MDWISCKDKLPEREKPVLIFHKGKIRIGELVRESPSYEDTFKAFDFWDDPFNDGMDWDHEDITHWMELPNPPV